MFNTIPKRWKVRYLEIQSYTISLTNVCNILKIHGSFLVELLQWKKKNMFAANVQSTRWSVVVGPHASVCGYNSGWGPIHAWDWCWESVLESLSLISGWWFGTFFIFPYIGNNHPNWLVLFRGVQTTNQICFLVSVRFQRCCKLKTWWVAGCLNGEASILGPLGSLDLSIDPFFSKRISPRGGAATKVWTLASGSWCDLPYPPALG